MLEALAARLMEAVSRFPGALWRHLLLSALVWLGFSSASAGGDTAPKCLLARPVRSAHASALRVAAARRGKAVAVWSEGSYGGRVLTVMNLHPFAGWRSERPQPPGPCDEGEARTAVNSAGAAVVVWTRSRNGFREVVAAHYHPRRGWHDAVLLDGSGVGLSPEVTLDEGGNALAVWNRVEAGGEGYSVMAARFTRHGWSGATTLHRNATSPAPSLSGNAAGEAVAMWTGLSRRHGVRRHHAYAAHFHTQTGWGNPAELGDAVVEREVAVADEATALPGVYRPVVALDEVGNAVGLWQEVTQEQGASRLMVTRFEGGKGWGRPQLLAENALDYSVAVGPEQTAHVCWTQSVGVSYVTSYVSSLSVATFTRQEGWLADTVLRCHPYLCRTPKVTAGRQGGVLVTWLNSDGATSQLWSVRSAQSGWGEPAAVSCGAAAGEYHLAASDGRTALVALTEESDDGPPAVKVLQVEL